MSDFRVGDEVIYRGSSAVKFVVTSISKNGSLNGIGADGVAFCDKNFSNWAKTGRHFVEAERLMEALQEEHR